MSHSMGSPPLIGHYQFSGFSPGQLSDVALERKRDEQEYYRLAREYGEIRARYCPPQESLSYFWSNEAQRRIPVFYDQARQQNEIIQRIDELRAQLSNLLPDTERNRELATQDAARILRKEQQLARVVNELDDAMQRDRFSDRAYQLQQLLAQLDQELRDLRARAREIEILPLPRAEMLGEIDDLEKQLVVMQRNQTLVFDDQQRLVDTRGEHIEAAERLRELEQLLRNHPHVLGYAPPASRPIDREVFLEQTLNATLAQFRQSDARVKPAIVAANGNWTASNADQERYHYYNAGNPSDLHAYKFGKYQQWPLKPSVL